MAGLTSARGLALRRRDDRIILHFDYDCFYASVFEAENPALKALPLAVQQKQIIVTCNYEARRRGLYKLQLVKEAKKACPDIVIVLGEDLTRFRNASKDLYNFLRSYSWNGKVERLGFDEVWMDVTDIIHFNIGLLNQNDLSNSFFCLSRDDPTYGFTFDASTTAGHTYPACKEINQINPIALEPNSLALRLNLGSHLAQHLRLNLEGEKGYTSTVGISTSKLLSKLVGNVHKPKAQTTLAPPYSVDQSDTSNVTHFIDSHEIGKIPGIGHKIAQRLRAYVLQQPHGIDNSTCEDGANKHLVSVKEVHTFPGMGVECLDRLLRGPGAPRDIGNTIWNLINGIDDLEVGQARDVPKTISIEDSYQRLDSLAEVVKQLRLLAASLIKQMHMDLLEEEDYDTGNVGQKPSKRWLAHPKSVRLSTRPRPPANLDGTRTRAFNRISRSCPVPNFIFTLKENIDALAERLVNETLLSMFRKLHPEKCGWNLSLINVAVTNMADAASDTKNASGRDIGKMFQRQEVTLKEWKLPDQDVSPAGTVQMEDEEIVIERSIAKEGSNGRHGSEDMLIPTQESQADIVWEEDEEDADDSLLLCEMCGASMPGFAMIAHSRFHAMPDETC